MWSRSHPFLLTPKKEPLSSVDTPDRGGPCPGGGTEGRGSSRDWSWSLYEDSHGNETGVRHEWDPSVRTECGIETVDFITSSVKFLRVRNTSELSFGRNGLDSVSRASHLMSKIPMVIKDGRRTKTNRKDLLI